MEPLFDHFFCCPLCRGLFPQLDDVRLHYLTCSGSPDECSAALFALPKAPCVMIKADMDHAYGATGNGLMVTVEEVHDKVEDEEEEKEEEREEEKEEEVVNAENEEEETAVKSKRRKRKRKEVKDVKEEDIKEDRPLAKKAKRLADIKEWSEKYKEFAHQETDSKGNVNVTYRCTICSKITKHVGFFKRHMVQCHPSPETDGSWKCEECFFTTDSKVKFNQHNYRHMKKHMCDTCSMRFTSKRDLTTHRYVHTDEKPFKCEQCDFSTRFQHAFKLHMRKHSGDLLQCDVEGCSFHTAYEWALKCHKNSQHDKSILYQCEFCSYISTNRSTLVRHQKTHLDVREFACMFCKYSAITKHEIVRHMRSHSKEKIYFCDRCDFSTSYSTGLRTHLMQHLNVKPFQCSVCEFCSITKQRVIQHQTSKHPNSDAHVIHLGLKLDIDVNQFKRKVTECYVVKGQEVKLDHEVNELVQGCVEVMMETEIVTETL